MQLWDENGRFTGVNTTQAQRVCDHCGGNFLSGYIRFARSYSEEAICNRCVEKRGNKRLLPFKP